MVAANGDWVQTSSPPLTALELRIFKVSGWRDKIDMPLSLCTMTSCTDLPDTSPRLTDVYS
jgi:hypothetical protein